MEEIVFPNQLRMLRRVRGRRMTEIAKLLGLSISALSKIEKGYRRLNAAQIQKVAKFLDCPTEVILVSSASSQPEVLKAWQDEQKKRSGMNLGGGLKTLGAGLRYIRGQKQMTLSGVAKGAKMTLSVYHRIEMGQREVDEKTFEGIARSMGMSADDLQLKIYELDKAGALDELKNNANKTGVALFKGGYNDLPMSRLMMRVAESKEITLPITGTVLENAQVKMHQDNPTGSVLCPSTLANDPDLYALRTVGGQANASLPEGAVLVVSPTMPLRLNDWVLVSQDDQTFFMQLKGMQSDMCEVVSFDKGKKWTCHKSLLQRIVWVVLI